MKQQKKRYSEPPTLVFDARAAMANDRCKQKS